MKAQFATIEATLSFAVIAVAAIFVSQQIGAANRSFQAEESRLAQAAAIYDIANEFERNISANYCLASYLSQDSVCMSSLVSNYEKVYGLATIAISGNMTAASSAPENGTACFEVYLQAENSTGSVCIAAGG